LSRPASLRSGDLDGAMDMRAIMAILLSAVVLAGCKPDNNTDITGSIDNCARQLYTAYNPKDLKQCIAVCISCQRGVMTTCSTSCTLKGAY
jgi:hypothetical protein